LSFAASSAPAVLDDSQTAGKMPALLNNGDSLASVSGAMSYFLFIAKFDSAVKGSTGSLC
jgi:hypothetical protein